MNTRAILKATGVLIALALVAVFVVPAWDAWATAGLAAAPPDSLARMVGMIGVAGMIVIPWQPALTREELDLMANPQAANVPECVPYQLYDTQNIANAATGPFTFFTALNNDKTLSNVESAGSFPDPQYFIVHYIAADFLQVPTATTLANEPNQALANVENILKTCRATITLSISNKAYGPFSLTMCHSTGGATFSGYGYGTAANGTSSGAVNNGIPGSGGFPVGGAIVIPPKVNYSVTVNLSTAATVSATVPVRVSLLGVLYRRVL
jgi:hypothetical protein